jgi:hypothetical protein
MKHQTTNTKPRKQDIMSSTNNGDGTETIVADGKGKRKSVLNPCQCWIPADNQTSTEVWKYTACKETCSNVFKQGHDAKLKGQIIRAFRAGVKMQLKGEAAVTPKALAKQYGWEHYLTEAPVRKARTAKPKAAKAVKAAKATKPEKPYVGATASFTFRGGVAVGRVTGVEGDDVEVVWTAKTGRVMSKTLKASEITVAA